MAQRVEHHPLEAAIACLVPDEQPLPSGGGNGGVQPLAGHAPTQWRLYANRQPHARPGGAPGVIGSDTI